MNLRRTVRWKNEDSFLSPVKAAHRFRGIYRFSEAATVVGIQAPLSSRNLELKPYAISSLATDRTDDPPVSNDLSGDVGFDVKYGLTKGLISDFTYNTDFAQVEEDERQVNLTRFSLFFPEKREFFLEGQNIFTFAGVQQGGGGFNRPGGSNQNLTPIMFFSRRIGLTEDGVGPDPDRRPRHGPRREIQGRSAQHSDPRSRGCHRGDQLQRRSVATGLVR